MAAALELARRFTEEEVQLAETLSGAEEAYRFSSHDCGTCPTRSSP